MAFNMTSVGFGAGLSQARRLPWPSPFPEDEETVLASLFRSEK